MPELIQDGPDIPVKLMNRRDDGKVVFFCGSGISVSTGLPNFDCLVSQVYDRTAQTKTELEQELLNNGQLDKVLGLLEGRLNPNRLRREVIGILTKPPPENSLATHAALINLSRQSDDSVRLVTTNFDNRFEHADPAIAIDGAPKLPLPKPHRWGSLVHLHGRITDLDTNGQDLVLTAADFGRAYLTERWASRFITELFREFTIVFVGYSLNDPVMSYMVDALAAERNRGARFQEAYAFADFTGGDLGRKRSELAWQGKSVKPILFDAQEDFGKLDDTLVKWAELSRDPIKSRRQIVFDELRKLPANADDPIAQRVTWAISDKRTAEALAESDAITEEDDYPILAGWLNVFDEAGLLCRPVNTLSDGSERQTPIVGTAFGHQANYPLDGISAQLASWLAKHLHVPQVLGWAARKGGYLHPYFRDLVRRRLSETGGIESQLSALPERLRLLWTILVQSTPVDHEEDLWWEQLIQNAASDAERVLVERALVASVRPHLTVMPGPSTHMRFRNLYDDAPAPLTPLEECAHLKLSACENGIDTGTGQAELRDNLLANHVFTITEHLRLAARLLPLDEAEFNHSLFCRPAIEDHDQNQDGANWTFLVEWSRDGYFALADRNPPGADLLIRLWAASDVPLLHRLALHVLAEDANADIHVATTLLLAGDTLNVWSTELHHEVMVFLRKAGQRLPAEDLGQLVKTIKAGPPSTVMDGGNEPKRQRDISLRLHKLASSGADIEQETRQLADAYQPPQDDQPDRDEFQFWSSVARWIGPSDHVRLEWQNGPPLDELIDQTQEGQLDEEEFEGVCRIWPSSALHALEKLSDTGKWPAKYWRQLLWSTNILRREGKLQSETLADLTTLILRAPDDLHKEIASAFSSYIEDLSEECSIEDEDTFGKLWNKAWSAVAEEADADTEDVLTKALNSAAGRLAEAAFKRLWKYEPEAGKGLPEPVSGYFDSIVTSDSGRLGRVMLAAKLSNIFAIAPDWTNRSLLPHLRWKTSKEARDLWAAYAWAARAGPNLFGAIKADFISALERYNEFSGKRSNLVYLFLAASIDGNANITPEDIQTVMANLPEDGLIHVAYFFENRLGDDESEQATTWENICLPWLQNYWPKTHERNTAETSIALTQCLIKTGTAFPKALQWAEEYLRPGTNHVLWKIKKSGVHTRFPIDTLKMLIKIISKNNLESWKKHILHEILYQMQETDQTISQNPLFLRLYRL